MQRLVFVLVLAVVVGMSAAPAVAEDQIQAEPVEAVAAELQLDQALGILLEAWGRTPRMHETSFSDWADEVLGCSSGGSSSTGTVSLSGGSGVDKSAFEGCLSTGGVASAADGSIDGSLGALGAGGDVQPIAVDCGTSSGAGVALAAPSGEGNDVIVDLNSGETLAEREARLVTEEKAAYDKAVDLGNAYMEGKASIADVNQAAGDYLKAVVALDEHRSNFGSSEGSTDPNAESGCAGTWEQVNQCAQTGYEAYDCWWLKPSEDCAAKSDPSVTDPAAVAEPQAAGSCPADPEAAAAALAEECGALTNPSPDGAPCAGESGASDAVLLEPLPAGCAGEGGGGSLEPVVGAAFEEPLGGGCVSQTCASPTAMPDGDQCLGEIDGPASPVELQAERTEAGESLLNGIGIITPPLPETDPEPQPDPGPEATGVTEAAAPYTEQP